MRKVRGCREISKGNGKRASAIRRRSCGTGKNSSTVFEVMGPFGFRGRRTLESNSHIGSPARRREMNERRYDSAFDTHAGGPGFGAGEPAWMQTDKVIGHTSKHSHFIADARTEFGIGEVGRCGSDS